MTTPTPLGDKMRALADTGHADAANLREKAVAFEAAATGYYGKPQAVEVRNFLGAYARARMAWSKASGEPLV